MGRYGGERREGSRRGGKAREKDMESKGQGKNRKIYLSVSNRSCKVKTSLQIDT